MFSLASVTSQQLFQFLPLSHAAALNGKSSRARKCQEERRKENSSNSIYLTGDMITSSLQPFLKNEGDLEKLIERINPLLSQIAAARQSSTVTTEISSYVSTDTFFENRNGFKHEYLNVDSPGLLLTHFLGHQSSLLNGISVRHFKTDRNTDAESVRNPGFFNRFRRSRPSSSASLGTLERDHLKGLLGENLSLEDGKKVKLAFAEGYIAGETTSTKLNKSQTKTLFYLQLTYYVLFIVLLFYVNKAVVSMFSKPSKNSNEVFPEDRTVTFDDVKGADEAKTELMEIVEFLKNPEKFSSLGGKIPRGVLLVGPPGTGKTLLARAVAGEAGVPYFHAAGPEFDEMLVGVGAKRVRELFSAAKARAPCVIFIDEIDSVGGKRTNSALHPFANQTINQLLSAMDGFHTNEGVIVLGATNRRDDLDKALLRPGRFDLEVQVPAPDFSGRVDILKLYLAKVKTGNDVNVEAIARGTTGFTGADIENLVNQAALRAAMDGATAVSMKQLESSRDKILMGPERKSRIPDEECNKLTAYHEAGHALVSHYTMDSVPLHKVTIIPRGSSLGHTAYMPEKERYHVTRAQMMASMDAMMGGRAAEELIFGIEKVTSGAASDLQQATSLATRMVKSWGMSEKVGLRYFEDNSKNMFAGGDGLSAGTTESIDSEIKKILQESYDRAKHILTIHKEEHILLAEALIKYETLDAEDVKAIFERKAVVQK